MTFPLAVVELNEFTIAPATPDQISLLNIMWAEEWSYGLPFEAICAFWEREESGEWSKDGALIAWVLVRRDDPEGTVYAGCETTRRPTLFKPKGSPAGSGDIKESWSYNISSVVTPTVHRGHGYATHMLRLLHDILALNPQFPPIAWGAPPTIPNDLRESLPRAQASTLWSDIGSDFYAKCVQGEGAKPGWVVDYRQQCEIQLDLLPPTKEGNAAFKAQWTTEWIYDDDVSVLAPIFHAAAVDRLKAIDATAATHFVVDPLAPGALLALPSRGRWLHEAKLEANGESLKEQLPIGVRIKSTFPAVISDADVETAVVLFAITNPQLTPASLLITYTHNLLPIHIHPLLDALDIAAAMVPGIQTLLFWGSDEENELTDAWMGRGEFGVNGRRGMKRSRPEDNGHLLAYAWYGYDDDQGVIDECQMWLWA